MPCSTLDRGDREGCRPLEAAPRAVASRPGPVQNVPSPHHPWLAGVAVRVSPRILESNSYVWPVKKIWGY